MGAQGGIYILDPDGKNPRRIIEHFNVDDMVFDADGGFYFTNYMGNPQNAEGSVQYVTPDMKSVTPVIENLAAPNGIALSTNGKILWITETNRGFLHRVDLTNSFHNTVPYKFEGFLGPDSCSVDEDDNLYVAMAMERHVSDKRGFGCDLCRSCLDTAAAGLARLGQFTDGSGAVLPWIGVVWAGVSPRSLRGGRPISETTKNAYRPRHDCNAFLELARRS
jgi:hypothetical protein